MVGEQHPLRKFDIYIYDIYDIYIYMYVCIYTHTLYVVCAWDVQVTILIWVRMGLPLGSLDCQIFPRCFCPPLRPFAEDEPQRPLHR